MLKIFILGSIFAWYRSGRWLVNFSCELCFWFISIFLFTNDHFLVFSAYVYYIISIENYQFATSTIKAAALVSCVVSGVLGDILVVEAKVALTVLMWISAGFVWGGFIVGLFVIRRPNEDNGGSSNTSAHKPLIEFEKVEDSSEQFSTTHPIKSLSKYQIFYQQLQCLYITLQSSTVLAMLSMWVIGNAVFQVHIERCFACRSSFSSYLRYIFTILDVV